MAAKNMGLLLGVGALALLAMAGGSKAKAAESGDGEGGGAGDVDVDGAGSAAVQAPGAGAASSEQPGGQGAQSSQGNREDIAVSVGPAVVRPAAPDLAGDLSEVVEALDGTLGKPPVAVKPPAVKPAPVKPPAVKPQAPANKPPPPVLTVNNPGAPAGYNPKAASNEARGLATHIQQKGYNFSRPALKTFQVHAGINNDGIYGPLSASALKYYAGTAPKALAKGAAGAPTTYTPPG